MAIPIEDNFEDILGKAQRGLNLAASELAQRAGISVAQFHAVKGGLPADSSAVGLAKVEALAKAEALAKEDAIIRKLAGVLHLGPDALVASAKKSWRPKDQPPIDGFAAFNTSFGDMTVNSYLVFDPQTLEAAAFDTGADADPMLQFIRDKHYTLR